MTIEEILNIFLPGVVCIYVYDTLAMKRYPLQTYTVAGAIIGTVIKFAVDWVNGMVSNYFKSDIPIFIAYIIFAAIVGFLYYVVKNSMWFRKVCADELNIDPADNFWKMHIDFKKDTLVILYLSSGKVVSGIIQSADDDYITLRNHVTTDKAYDDVMIESMKHPNTATLMCVPVKNVARFEIGYKNDSKYNDIIFRH